MNATRIALLRLQSVSLLTVVLFALTREAHAFTKTGKSYTTDGSQADVTSAITNASNGDVVNVPAGSFTWGANLSGITINKPITLKGAGPTTIITLDPTSNQSFTVGVFRITAAATIRDFTITVPSTAHITAFNAIGANDWRVTNITFNGGTTDAYFFYISNAYGLIDNCSITGGNPQAELIFVNGPTDSWSTVNSLGGQSNVFVEDCAFNGSGYVCDANAYARMVVRFCTINGTMKIDAHGFASNSGRGVREMEVYDNHWTAAAASWWAMELRGGTGMVFDNICDHVAGTTTLQPFMELNDYGVLNTWPNFSNVYQTPTNYPINDQIGVGKDPKTAGSEPYYLWNNVRSSVDWVLFQQAPAPGAITLFGSTFTMADIVQANRDYFKQVVGAAFDGIIANLNALGGVGRGTVAQMNLIHPTKSGVGFWVTDEASWRAGATNTSGQLYTWSGSAWTLKYTPYPYPHPLRAPRAPSNAQLGP